MEAAAIIFIFFAVIVLTAVLFGGWLLFTIIRLIVRGIGAIVAPLPQSEHGTLPEPNNGNAVQGRRCGMDNCRNLNPMAAQFCRRCGRPLPAAERVNVQRAAMW